MKTGLTRSGERAQDFELAVARLTFRQIAGTLLL